MQYFVSIENCQYFRLQLELLYESMRILGIENELIIGCANLEKKQLRFPNVFYHENFGRKNNYLPFNKTFSLWTALENNLIKQPFAVIDPDVVILQPLEISEKSYSQYNYYLEHHNITKAGFEIPINWKNGGEVYFFNNCDELLLKKIHQVLFEIYNSYRNKNKFVDLFNAGNLENDQPPLNCSNKIRSNFWQIEMVAFAFILSEINCELKNISSNLYQNKCYNIIHYCNGFLPYFHKLPHNNLRKFSINQPLPFDCIMNIPNLNNNIISFKKITKSFIEKKSDLDQI